MRVLCNEKGEFFWRTLECKGFKPPGRKMHSMEYLPGLNSLIVVGGKDKNDTIISEIHLFNLQTLSWAVVDVIGESFMESRFGHVSLIHEGKLIIASGESSLKKRDWFSGQFEISK